MQDLFQCPHCGARTLVDPEYIGQTGPCAECGQTITIWVQQTTVTAGNNPKPDRTVRRPVLPVILAVFALLGIVAVVITVFVTSKSKPNVAPVVVKQRSALATTNIKSIGAAIK